MEDRTSVGIIGAGIMGQGLAHLCAKFNHSVVLVDLNDELLDQARGKIKNLERFDILLQKQKKSVQGLNGNIMESIRFSSNIQDVGGASIIIENVPEKFEIKREVYQKLNTIVAEKALIGANTSATPITKLAALMKYPKNVIGLHFSNPVNLLSTVEMVKGHHYCEQVLERARQFLATLQMKAILVNDSPGFVSNRIMLVYINEAIFCVQEDVASPEAIDGIFKECLAHSMGPLATADLIGLDTILFSLEVLYQNFSDSKYRPAPLLRKMVDAGTLGRKTGAGFYKY